MTPGGDSAAPFDGAPAEAQDGAPGESASSPPRWRRVVLFLVTVAFVGATAWAVNVYAVRSEAIRDAVAGGGYPALVAMSAASGFNLAVPIPIVSFFPFFMEIGMHPGWTLAAIALGMTVGDMVGFGLGAAGRRALDGREVKAFRHLQSLHDRHPKLPLFALLLYAAFAPIPNEIVVIPMALMGYPFIGVAAVLLTGNAVFNTLGALGALGVFGAIG